MTDRRVAKAYSAAKMERDERRISNPGSEARRRYNQVDRREARALLRTLSHTEEDHA